MARLDMSLLGTLNVTRDGRPIPEPTYGKVLGLLAYLAVEADRVHQRAHIAALFWPDHPEDRARHNLRQALTTLRRIAGHDDADAPCLLVQRDTIAFNPDSGNTVDVQRFTHLLDECDAHPHADPDLCVPCTRRLRDAVSLYRGGFLEGFTVPDSEEFETWAAGWRQRLQDQALQALEKLVAAHRAQGNTEDAIEAARRQLEIDSCLEPAHRSLMVLLWQSGNRAAALAQYARCEAVLDEELGIEPEDETRTLYERIRDGDASPSIASPRSSVLETVVRLPVPISRMVGREREAEELLDLLAHPDCRLLTITGPGGVGKTRLAIHVAASLADTVATTCFVPLASLQHADGIATAITTALGLQPQGSMSPEDQLTAWLRDRSVLLVLDNVEQLIDHLDVLSRMLEAAPDLHLLVTSRERLNLTGEWVYSLDGLAFPRTLELDDVEGYDAVDLLSDRIRHVRGGTSLRHDERAEVVRICQLVDGMPLALELAAAWANTISLREIADAISENLDILSAANRDSPDRHQSMRAVCTSTWERLTTDEQSAWRRLSVFRRGFTLDAADRVAGASLQNLAALINKSLLVRLPSGRYRMHGLLAQFGIEMLQQDADEHVQMCDRHGRYYLRQLANQEDLLTGRDQPAALAQIEADIDNIRAAWSWSVEHRLLPEVIVAAPALWLFFVIRGWMREGSSTFGMLLHALAHTDPETPGYQLAMGMAKVYSGGFESGLGQYAEGTDRITRGIELLREVTAGRIVGLALNMHAAALNMMGRYDEARACLEESLEEFGRSHDAWGTAFSLNDLGMLMHLRFNDERGETYCAQARDIFRRVGDGRGQAFAADNLGMIATQRGEHTQAQGLHSEALSLSEESDDQWGVATSLVQLGRVETVTHDDAHAREHLTRAVQIAWEGSFSPVVLEALTELATLETDADDARTMLTAILRHPAVQDPLRDRATTLLRELGVEDFPEPTIDIEDRWAIRTVNDRARALIEAGT